MSTATLTYRQRQAAETRHQIVRAARRVFAAKGYGAATIADVAAAAGVAIPTIYKLYGSKRSLLAAVSDSWAQDYAPRQPETLPFGPVEAIKWWAATVRKQWEAGLDIGMIYAGAVTSEPDVQEDLQPRLAARERAIRTVAERIGGALRQDQTPETAAAIISSLSIPEVYRDLVRDRGWTPEAYECWLEQTLTQQLLAQDDHTSNQRGYQPRFPRTTTATPAGDR
jgi:AcrR family transcriptional regulator